MVSKKITLRKKPVVLLILDGVGHGDNQEDNAVFKADLPNWQRLCRQYAYGVIDASEEMVGLPGGQFGNSEVGHLHIGAGRLLKQVISRVNDSIATHEFEQLQVMQEFAAAGKNGRAQLLGLFSDGGVHSHIDHFFAVLDFLTAHKVKEIFLHLFLDGRDTPPKSAEKYLPRLLAYIKTHPQVKVGSIGGRFYAMDRDGRWERVEKAYDALTGGPALTAASVSEALANAYDRGESDEFITPTVIDPQGALAAGDAVLFMNFRADRARQLTAALTRADFAGFKRCRRAQFAYFATLTDYGRQFNFPVVFADQPIINGFGAYIAAQGLRQLRIAETEKYPHVTYFFSGGREEPYPLEQRILVPSPKVRTYDLQPEMGAYGITENILRVVKTAAADVIICNFANGDMVGHTGDLAATVKALEVLDSCLGKITAAVREQGGEVLITADHGNCEKMYDEKHCQPHTQHTTNPVPFLYIGEPAVIKKGGSLKDIAPTMLALLGITPPAEMTGHNLITFTT